MAIKRSELIDPQTPAFYHLISRCVRRAYLCGTNKETGQSYEHRRQWLENRILFLTKIFSVQLFSYAVMPNHYHLVIYSDPLAPRKWSDKEVAQRWLTLFPGSNKDNQNQEDQSQKINKILGSPELIAIYRQRLGSVSWLMKCLNEPIAKRANREDSVKGHFWESRFRSQALLDENAAIICMAYVDLNPIRARLTKKLEESTHTSIKRRISHLSQDQLNRKLEPISGTRRTARLSILLKDYIELVEWTGKFIIHPKKSSIPKNAPALLLKLKIPSKNWIQQVNYLGGLYYRVIGSAHQMEKAAMKYSLNWVKGKRSATKLYQLHT